MTERTKQTEAGSRFDWRMVPPPEPQEDYWPNERLFLFRDFCVLPHNNPFDLHEKNVKVTPSVTLGLTEEGVLVRDPLPPEIEQLLVWRIYHNGRLVDKSEAGNATRHPADHGQGIYQAFLCVDGPSGPMPVSNFVEFPLFQEKSGKRTVFPRTVERLGFPDLLIGILTPGQLDRLYEQQSDIKAAPKRRYNIAATSVSTSTLSPCPTNPEALQTLLLWQSWSIYLNDFLERNEEKGSSSPSWLWMIHLRE